MQILARFFAKTQPDKNSAGLLWYKAMGKLPVSRLNIASLNIDQVD